MNTSPTPPRSIRWANVCLIVLGAASLLLVFKGRHSIDNGRIITFTGGAMAAAAVYFLAAWVVLRAPAARSTLIVALGFAAAFRLVALQTPTCLSTDLYRYIWDGRVQAAGINPYKYLPADEHLAHLRDNAIYPHINRPTYAKTIYPPVAQAVFWGLTHFSETPMAMRLAFVGCEALAVWALALLLRDMGQPMHRVLLYAWNPLPLWEFASGGHVDALLIAFLAWTFLAHRRGWEIGTGVLFGGVVLSKLFPLVLFPALYRRWRWGWKMPLAFALTVALGYAPYIATYNAPGVLGFLPGYTNEEGLRSGERFYLMSLLPSGALHALGLSTYNTFVVLIGMILVASTAWALWGGKGDEQHTLNAGLALATIFTATLSSGYDWYYSWLTLFLCLLPYSWLFWLTASSMILYLNWYHFDPTDVYLQNTFIYLPAAFLGLWSLSRPLARRYCLHAPSSVANLPDAALAEGAPGT